MFPGNFTYGSKTYSDVKKFAFNSKSEKIMNSKGKVKDFPGKI